MRTTWPARDGVPVGKHVYGTPPGAPRPQGEPHFTAIEDDDRSRRRISRERRLAFGRVMAASKTLQSAAQELNAVIAEAEAAGVDVAAGLEEVRAQHPDWVRHLDRMQLTSELLAALGVRVPLGALILVDEPLVENSAC